jgi:hypothetical protein
MVVDKKDQAKRMTYVCVCLRWHGDGDGADDDYSFLTGARGFWSYEL